MKRIVTMGLLFAGELACGSSGSGGDGGDKPTCSGPGTCPSGQYCAMYTQGNVCWPDTVAPSVTDVKLTCADSPCLRTSKLHVEATVTDDKSLGGAGGASVVIEGPEVAAGAGPTQLAQIPLTKGNGDAWTADVSLVDFPFFEAKVTAKVTARNTSNAGYVP